jgi:hypothetical protein
MPVTIADRGGSCPAAIVPTGPAGGDQGRPSRVWSVLPTGAGSCRGRSTVRSGAQRHPKDASVASAHGLDQVQAMSVLVFGGRIREHGRLRAAVLDLDQHAGPVGRQPQPHRAMGAGGLACPDRVGDELGDDQFGGPAKCGEDPVCEYPAGVVPGPRDSAGKRGEFQVTAQRPGLLTALRASSAAFRRGARFPAGYDGRCAPHAQPRWPPASAVRGRPLRYPRRHLRPLGPVLHRGRNHRCSIPAVISEVWTQRSKPDRVRVAGFDPPLAALGVADRRGWIPRHGHFQAG